MKEKLEHLAWGAGIAGALGAVSFVQAESNTLGLASGIVAACCATAISLLKKEQSKST